jgi:DNA-directed RNA polymerase specialized sigma24 family protein
MKQSILVDISVQQDFVRLGNKDALQRLLAQHGDLLYSFLQQRLGPRADEAFVKTCCAIVEEAYSGPAEQFTGWLFWQAARASKNHKRTLGQDALWLAHNAHLSAPAIALALQVPISEAIAALEEEALRQAADVQVLRAERV